MNYLSRAVKRLPRNCFHVLTVYQNGTIECYIDYPLDGGRDRFNDIPDYTPEYFEVVVCYQDDGTTPINERDLWRYNTLYPYGKETPDGVSQHSDQPLTRDQRFDAGLQGAVEGR